MQGILSCLNALRHRRGFGIHSPFAYKFITEVLCQHHAYYAYAALGHDSGRRLLVRLVAFFHPHKVEVMAADAPSWLAAAEMADSACTKNIGDADFAVVDAEKHAVDEMLPFLDSGAHLMIINADSKTLPALTGYMSHGMTFANSSGTIVVANYPHLPQQNFKVKF